MDMEVHKKLIKYILIEIGSIVSKFVANNFVKLLTKMKSYKLKNYEQALIETYLKFDELLKNSRVDAFLKEYLKNSIRNRIDVTLSYHESTHADIMKDQDFLMNDMIVSDNVMKSSSDSSQSNWNSSVSPRKKSTDVKDGEDCSSSSSKSKSGKSDSKEELELDQAKLKISLKNINSRTKEELLAKDMGSTANIVLIKNNYIYIANVGDSMAVLFKNGQAIRLNQEHKTSLPSEFTRINKSGSRIVNNRIEGRLNLTRAIGIMKFNKNILGDLTFKNNSSLKFYEQAVISYPEITKIKITKDIDFIFMACDGVWDCVDIQKVCEHISVQLKTKKEISTILADLVDQIIAKANNSKNII